MVKREGKVVTVVTVVKREGKVVTVAEVVGRRVLDTHLRAAVLEKSLAYSTFVS